MSSSLRGANTARFSRTEEKEKRDSKQTNDRPEEDHAHARYGGRRGAAEVVSLEEKVDVGSELDALSAGHRQQPVVVQHRVQALDPLWVNVTVAHDPRAHLCGGETG